MGSWRHIGYVALSSSCKLHGDERELHTHVVEQQNTQVIVEDAYVQKKANGVHFVESS